jgi:hypothetical protein
MKMTDRLHAFFSRTTGFSIVAFVLGMIVAVTVTVRASTWVGPQATPPGQNVSLSLLGQWTNGSGGAVYYNGGNVGIGTANPLATLEVDGTSNCTTAAPTTGGISLWHKCTEGGAITMNDDSTNPNTFVHLENLNGIFRVLNSAWNTQLFSVDQSGNVAANGTVSAAAPAASTNLTTKAYVDAAVGSAGGSGAPSNFQVFRSSGTWTKPGSGSMAYVECWGGGGSGTMYGGAGGGKGYAWFPLSSLTASVAVTVGSGGTSGAAGGNTTFGSYLTANGGAAGSSGGAVGGSASGTGVAVASGGGSGSSTYSPGGSGGGSNGGGGGSGNGGAGGVPGGGGGGQISSGGAGAAGECIVTVY